MTLILLFPYAVHSMDLERSSNGLATPSTNSKTDQDLFLEILHTSNNERDSLFQSLPVDQLRRLCSLLDDHKGQCDRGENRSGFVNGLYNVCGGSFLGTFLGTCAVVGAGVASLVNPLPVSYYLNPQIASVPFKNSVISAVGYAGAGTIVVCGGVFLVTAAPAAVCALGEAAHRSNVVSAANSICKFLPLP